MEWKATERNRELVEGELVRLESDTTDRDAHGRLLRYVYVDKTFVNAVFIVEQRELLHRIDRADATGPPNQV